MVTHGLINGVETQRVPSEITRFPNPAHEHYTNLNIVFSESIEQNQTHISVLVSWRNRRSEMGSLLIWVGVGWHLTRFHFTLKTLQEFVALSPGFRF